VPLNVLEQPNAAQVAASRAHDQVADAEFDVVLDLSGFKVDLDGVVGLNVRVRVTDRAAVVRCQEGDALRAKLNAPDFAQLEPGFLGLDTVQRKAALRVIKEAEVLVRAVDRDDVHEAGRESCIRPDLAINLDYPLHQNKRHFTSSQRVFEAIAQ